MTDKFIPFNPETAKNGDIVYGKLTGHKYLYVGEHPAFPDRVVTYKASERRLGFELPENLEVKAPKKTVWVNVYKSPYGDGFLSHVYDTEYGAKSNVIQCQSMKYIGTYPLEIDDVA